MRNGKSFFLLLPPAYCLLPTVYSDDSLRTLALPAAWLPADNSDRDADSLRRPVSPPPAKEETFRGRVVDRLHLSNRDPRVAASLLARFTRTLPGCCGDVRARGGMFAVLVGVW